MDALVTSPSCERNKDPILEVLTRFLTQETTVFEIGSATAEHATYFCEKLPHLHWITSDLLDHHTNIQKRLGHFKMKNIVGPRRFEVGVDDLPNDKFEVIYTCNTFHIMSWKKVKTLIKLIGKRFHKRGMVIIYGPFNYHGNYTSESNEKFDQWLKGRDPQRGIRNFEDVTNAMVKAGFFLEEDVEMPANNRMLIFKKG